MWKCTNCGSEIENDNLLSCWNCGYGKDGSPPADQEAFKEAKSVNVSPQTARTRPPVEEMFTRRRAPVSSTSVLALRIFGWVALVAGLFAGGFILVSGVASRSEARESSDLYNLVVAFTTAFQGAFVFVLCRVIAEIADEVQVVRAELMSQRFDIENLKR